MKDDKKYIDSIHNLGRLGSFIAVCFMMGIPAIMCTVYDAWPSMSTVIQAGGGLLAMFVPSAFSEVISYAPILGSASYITFITGNVMNLKLPVAISAQQIAGVEANTPESDAISTMAIALSSLETIAIIAVGVLMLKPLQPVLTLPAVSTCTAYMVPALMGGLMLGVFKQSGKVRIKNKMLVAVAPITMSILGLIFIEGFTSKQGFAILGAIPLTLAFAFILWKKGIVKQIMIDENGVEHDME
ncbi:MAG: hypothetical protein IKY90_05015 [Oscillospiraceae bacterium]|nr:hypothetical protein [Oscillospiraceae bacterium]